MLKETHEVHTVVCAWSSSEAAEARAEAGPMDEIVLLSRYRGLARALGALVRSDSLQQAYLDDRKLRTAIRGAVELLQPDAVFFNVIRTAALVDEVGPSLPTILDLDEVRSEYYAQLKDKSVRPLQRAIGRIEAPRMRNAEHRALERFTTAFVSSPSDLDAGDNVELVRTPANPGPVLAPETSSAEPAERATDEITLVGRMSYGANIEAAQWFATKILPSIRQHRPGIVLNLVGEAPSRSVRSLASEAVRVTGAVPAVEPWLRKSTLAIVPVTMATGVQMKLLEAFATNTPVVTTPIVAKLAGVDARHCYIADSPAKWIETINSALDDPSGRAQKARRASAWLASSHSWTAVRAQLDGALRVLSDRLE